MTDAERLRLKVGNVIISRYMFHGKKGNFKDYFPIGYTREGKTLYRYEEQLSSDQLPNYHCSFDILMPVVARIQKESSECPIFSDEDVHAQRVKDALFECSGDPLNLWSEILNYIAYKNKEQKPF
jgi:hypothetical protein